MNPFEQNGENEPPHLVCSHLLACHTLWYDNTNADSGYSLGRVIVHVRPDDGGGFPFRLFRFFLFAQLHGTPAEYVVRVKLVRIEVDAEQEE